MQPLISDIHFKSPLMYYRYLRRHGVRPSTARMMVLMRFCDHDDYYRRCARWVTTQAFGYSLRKAGR
jgi:hypothetical protein